MRHLCLGENAVAKGTSLGFSESHQRLPYHSAKLYVYEGVGEEFCSLFYSGLYRGDISDQGRDVYRIAKQDWFDL